MAKQPRKKQAIDITNDSRVQRSKQAVLAATHELLKEEGFSGVTVDAVSERSGVAKTTIYRHWPSRAALLIAACSELACRLELADAGSLRGDLIALVTKFSAQLRAGIWSMALPSVIDAAERDPEVKALLSAMNDKRMAYLEALIEQAKQRGDLLAECDIREMAANLFGPLFYRRYFSQEPLTDRFLEHVVDTAMNAQNLAR